MVRQQLVTVADSKYRNARRQNIRVDIRAALLQDTGRAAGDDDALARPQRFQRRIARLDIGINAKLADTPGDQMRVLAARIQYGNLRS